YSDSKLYVLMLSMAVARKWSNVYANAVDPGWVPARMGGHGAPDDLQKGCETQTWLAVSNDSKAKVSGRYFHHRTERRYNAQASDIMPQERFLNLCRDITGIPFPHRSNWNEERHTTAQFNNRKLPNDQVLLFGNRRHLMDF
ncbi:MAG: hypothetical protein ACXW4Q_16395, partial [Anaerolineales bacterium]